MSNSGRNNLIILIIRWAARIISIGLAGFFALFFIGEWNINELIHLNATDMLLMFFVPILFMLGVIISWRKELYNLKEQRHSQGSG